MTVIELITALMQYPGHLPVIGYYDSSCGTAEDISIDGINDDGEMYDKHVMLNLNN